MDRGIISEVEEAIVIQETEVLLVIQVTDFNSTINGRGGFMGNSSRGNSGRRGGRGGNNNNNGRGNNVQKICRNCGELNHIARFCTAPWSGNC